MATNPTSGASPNPRASVAEPAPASVRVEDKTDPAVTRFGHRYLVRFVAFYVLFAVLWIFVSDELLAFLIRDPESLPWLGMAKGWLFILITTSLLYLLISRFFRALLDRDREILALNAGLERRVAERTGDLEAQIAERRRVEGELRLSEARHRLLAEHSIDVIWALNAQGEMTYISPSVERVLGYSREEYLRLPPTKTYSPAAWELVQEGMRQGIAAVQAGKPFEFHAELENIRKDGARNWSDVKGTALYDEQGRFLEFFGITRDITERKRHEQELRELNANLEAKVQERTTEIQAALASLAENESRFRTIFNSVSDGIIIQDAQTGEILDVNERVCEWFGGSHEEVLAAGLSALLAEDQPYRQTDALEKIRLLHAEGPQTFEWLGRARDGTTFWVEVSLRLGVINGRSCVLALTRDISARKQAQERIEFLAYHDPLTGLPNRLLGRDRLAHEVADVRHHRTRLAVLVLDLDQFKYINDTHGHALGDRLLQDLTGRLRQTLRPVDTLCRLSADEFLVLLPELHPSQWLSDIAAACDRLLDRCATPFDLDGHQVHVTFSLGVAVYPEDGLDGETLMRNANTALHEAKRNRRHGYRFFEPAMNDALTRFIHTRDALRLALEREEFVLHYQPQIELDTGRVLGAEALIRWQRPGVGLVPPGDFIDVAEESGLIVPLGRWVLREACRQAAAWRARGWPDLVVAVNLSAVQFRHPSLGEEVRQALAESGLAPQGLDLELTESILLQGEEGVLGLVAEWKAQGIQLSIDDFGTGYSSLAYLKRFKVDKIKIDRSFVANLLTDEGDRAIVQAMIQIARVLNFKTLAEGVEDVGLADRLRLMGCDLAQGHLYARPLPATDLERWMTESPAALAPAPGPGLGPGPGPTPTPSLCP